MKNIIISLNIGVLLLIILMFTIQSSISIIGAADGVTDILIPTVFGFGMIYILVVAILNIYWLWKRCLKDIND